MTVQFGQIIHTAEPQRLLMESEAIALTNSRTVGSGCWIMQDGRKTVAIFIYDPFQDYTNDAWPCWWHVDSPEPEFLTAMTC